MNHRQAKRIMASALATGLLAGCVPTTPYYDANFGETVDLAKAQQIRDPDAGRTHPLPDGVDGVVAKEMMDRYHKSYREAEPQPGVFTIGVSGGSGGGSP